MNNRGFFAANRIGSLGFHKLLNSISPQVSDGARDLLILIDSIIICIITVTVSHQFL